MVASVAADAVALAPVVPGEAALLVSVLAESGFLGAGGASCAIRRSDAEKTTRRARHKPRNLELTPGVGALLECLPGFVITHWDHEPD